MSEVETPPSNRSIIFQQKIPRYKSVLLGRDKRASVLRLCTGGLVRYQPYLLADRTAVGKMADAQSDWLPSKEALSAFSCRTSCVRASYVAAWRHPFF